MRILHYCTIALLCAAAMVANAATTYSVTPASSLQTVINGTVAGDTVSFGPGTYSVSSSLTLKCGVTYTGPVATPATAILASTFGQSGAIFNLFTGSGFANPCTQKTSIQYFKFANSGGIYVQTSFTNLNILYNQFANIPCCNAAEAATTGMYFDGSQSTSNTAQVLSNTLIQWNTIGDSASCLSPASAFADTTSADGNGNAGSCNGLITNTAINGLTVWNNNFFHVSEGMHILCPGGGHPGGLQPCQAEQNGVATTNVDIEFNDITQAHRIPYEEQPQGVAGVKFMNNSIHDMISPTFWSFGVSFACCGQGTKSPPLQVRNNLIILNTTPIGRYGYGSEDWGGQANYDNNYIASPGAASYGMAWGYGPVSTMNNNTVCGAGFAAAGYQADEGYGAGAPTRTGNVLSSSCSSIVSVAPTISPTPTGTYSSPVAVTITDNGYTSGPQPLGNTTIHYTTDGSTPTVSSTPCVSPCLVTVAPGATVKALGMWGAPNQPTSYVSGYGFTPSGVASARYPAGGGGPPTFNSITLSCPSTALTAGASSEQCSLACNYSDGTHPDCTGGPDLYGHGPGIYMSSQPLVVSISSSAVVAPLTAGAGNVTATIGALSSTVPISVASSGGGGGPAPVFLGNNAEDVTGITFANAFNSVYSISPPYPTTVGAGHFFLPTDTITSGAHYDILVILAPTPTTEASTPLCKATYTTTSATAPNAWVATPALSGCGTIPASTAYWVAVITNDPSGPNYGFSDCASSCTGSAPTTYGTGTYPSYYIGGTYGTYTSLPSTLNAHTGTQVSQYVDLTPTAPTLAGGYQDTTLNVNTIIAGSGFVLHAFCVYSDGVILQCDTTDARGNAVTAWTETSSGVVLSIGAVGSGSPGLVTGVNYGQANTNCTLTGGVVCNTYIWTVTNQPATTIKIQGMAVHGMKVNN